MFDFYARSLFILGKAPNIARTQTAEKFVRFYEHLLFIFFFKMSNKKPPIMFGHPSTRTLCNKIKVIDSNLDYREEGIEWNKFPDGLPNIFVKDILSCKARNIILVASFHQLPIIFEQLSVYYMLPRVCIKSLILILPYFPTGTMERVDTEGQVATASSMARMLSAQPLSMTGPTQLMIFDIHALQERFFFTDHVIPLLVSAIPSFISVLEKTQKDWSIAFPDEGAYKRFYKYFNEYQIIRCIKKRSGSSREVTIVDGKTENCNIVIVDDLIMTGGTMIECMNALKKAGAASISLYVTHAVFPQNSWQKFCGHDFLENFWITDSIPHANQIATKSPFKLISLASSICEALNQ